MDIKNNRMKGEKMPKSAILECKNIWKKIGTKVIIKDVSLKLYEGDIVGFIGANGAGKTTTMKLILGLQPLNGGTVEIKGYSIKKEFAKAISQVGAIIENPDMYMYMSGYENLALAAKYYNTPKQRIDEVIKIVGLEDRIHDKVRKYSLGMRQRLGIASAILHNPKLLILDEPMNGLDPEGIAEFKELLTKLANEEHMAILISSHILSELENICTRICILSKGIIIKDETIESIKAITNKQTYIVEVNTTNLNSILYNYKEIDKNHIKITTNKEQLNNIIKTLLLNEISIYEIKKETLSLEEIFLDISKK